MADQQDSMPQTTDQEISDTDECDNHPGRPAVLVSDLGGQVQTIRLCEECVPASLQKFVDQ